MKRKELVVAILLAAGSASMPALAAPNYTATVSGATASDGKPQNATADFTFNSTFTGLSLTLTNTAGVGQLQALSSILDGISFSLGGVQPSALALTSLSNPAGTITCSVSCSSNPASVSLSTSGWTYDAGESLLAAGNGSFKPYGVANGNIGNFDGIPNGQHNPYLNGPVTFEFTISNSAHTALSLESASLYFGTKPDVRQAVITSVPEPESYAMLLAGLGLIGTMARRRRSLHGG